MKEKETKPEDRLSKEIQNLDELGDLGPGPGL